MPKSAASTRICGVSRVGNEQPVGEAAQPVVDEEHRDERQPVEDDARTPSQVGDENAAIPSAEPDEDEVVRGRDAPQRRSAADVPAPHATGAPTRSYLRRVHGRTLECCAVATTAARPRAPDRRRARRDRRLDRGPLARTRARSSAGSRRAAPPRRAGRSMPPTARDARRRCPRTSARGSSTGRRGCSRSGSEEAARIDLRRGGQADEGGAGRGAARASRRSRSPRSRRASSRARWCRWTRRRRATGKLALTLRLPIGIVGAISPFNFPLNLVAHKVAPALAAGCAVVLKPASATPLVRALPRRARGGGRAAARLAERRLRLGRRRSATCSSRTSA